MHIHYLGKLINKPLAITIGNFDGIHIGHQYILKQLDNFAKQNNMQSAVMSFYPHPRQVLNIDKVLYIDTLRQKISKLLNYVDNIYLTKFTKKLAQLSPEDFVKHLYNLNIKYIVVGDDFYFGHKRSANAHDLKKLASHLGIKVEVLDSINTHQDKRNKLSSTILREALQQADLIKFKNYTNKDFFYINKVCKGKQIGRTIGFPTINLKVKQNFILPTGIYAVYVQFINYLDDTDNLYLDGVASLGYRPTVELNNNSELLLEVHILNWQGNAYNKKAKVIFLDKIRDEKKYPSLEIMQQAIDKDIEIAKIIHNTHRKSNKI